ncbi:MAG TPA: globin family protein [Rhizobacter sp.]|nr:globin family protein [Rhizobacter sp.]
MTPVQIDLVRDSFELVAPIAPQTAAIFYDNLFTAKPALRTLFKGNMVQQGERLMTMIATAVKLLDQPEILTPALNKLGARHVTYGVRDEDYETVGNALIKTLQQGLGDAFTAEMRSAWTAMYGLVSQQMIAASHQTNGQSNAMA